MVGARGEGGRKGGSCPRCPVPSPCSPPAARKNFDGEKCPLPRCELLNVIFARKQIFASFFVFPNIKKQANLRLLLHVQKLKVFQLQGVSPP